MIGIVYITWLINAMYAILSYITFRLRAQCINSGYVVHMLCIVMNQIRVHSVVTHTVHCLRPAPAKADAAIRNFADFIVFYINISHIPRKDCKTSPIFITHFGKVAITDLLMRAYFPKVGRVVRQMCFMGSRRETADHQSVPRNITKKTATNDTALHGFFIIQPG